MLIRRASGRALAAALILSGVLAVSAPPAYALGSMSVADASGSEGTGGSRSLQFVVSVSIASVVDVTVDYATSNGSATAGSDYTAAAGQLTIPAGTTSAVISVSVATDAIPEPNETLTLTISNPSGGTLVGDGQATGTITNDDGLPPALSVNDPTTTETDAAGTIDFAVSLPSPALQDITVSFATSAGTASAGTDFGTSAGTATITAGTSTTDVSVPVVGDDLDEADEAFTLTLTNPTNATIADGTGSATIADDDDLPVVQSDAPSAGETDASTSLVFTVSLSTPSGRTATVDYTTSDGTATAGIDYTATSGTLIFAPGDTTEAVTVPVTGDDLDEPDETVVLTLVDPVSATVGAASSVGTIVDDESVPAVSIGDLSIAEGADGVTSAEVTVTLSTPSGQTVTVDAATEAGTASPGTDYQPAQATLTFPPGTTTRTLSVPVVGDALDESDESVPVVLSAPTAAVIADGAGTLTIVDDDATPSLSLPDGSVTEGNAGNGTTSVTLALSAPSGRDVSVDISTTDGTAAGGTDFATQTGTAIVIPAGAQSASVPATVFGDLVDETDETFNLNLSNVTNALVSDGTGVITILDDDSGPVIGIGDATQLEGSPPPAADTAFAFTVTLAAPSEQTVTVGYATVDATATAGATEDYDAATGTVTFTPGQTSRPVTVNVNRDLHAEPVESFLVVLSAPVNASLGSDGSGVGTINNDDGPAPSVSIADATVAETSATATVTATLSQVATQDVIVDAATTDGTATAPVDYTAATATLTIPAGETSASLTVPIADDDVDEPAETLTVTLSNARNAAIGDAAATLTIDDDDTAPSFSIADASVTEGDSGSVAAVFTVTLSAPSAQTVSVRATAADVSTSAADHAALDTVLTFTPGDTSESVTVQVTGDTAPEADEAFVVTLSQATGATVADGSGAGAVHDDDAQGTFTAVSPARVLDTRIGVGRPGTAKVGSGETITVDVTGTGGVPAAGVAAVAVNVTVTEPGGNGFVTATATGGSATSNVNYATGEVVANLVVVPVGPDGSIRLFSSQSTHLVGDVFGWFATDAAPAPGSHFVSVPPARLLDTRTGHGAPNGSTSPVQAGATRALDVTGAGGVPATGVSAVVLNVTVTQPTASSFLSVTPEGGTATSNTNFVPGETVAGLVIVPVGPDGSIRYAVAFGTAHVVADVLGWFADPGTLTGSVLTTVEPARLVDTRDQPGVPLGPQESGILTVAGEGGVPATGVASAVLNLTVDQPTAPSFLAATPDGAPGTSNLNFVAHQTVANLAIVPLLPADGAIDIFNHAGEVHVIVDVFAWFSTPTP